METNKYRLVTVNFNSDSVTYVDALNAIPGAEAYDNAKTTLYGVVSPSTIYVHGLTEEMGSANFSYQIAYVADLQDSTRASQYTRASQFWSTSSTTVTIPEVSNSAAEVTAQIT